MVSSPGISELRAQIIKMVPNWNEKSLTDFHYLEGGFTNNNFLFNRSEQDRTTKYVLRCPIIKQPLQNRVAENLVYHSIGGSITPSLVAFDTGSGALITHYVPGDILVESSTNHYDPRKLTRYLNNLHQAIPRTTKSYDLSRLMRLFVPGFDGKDFPEIKEINHTTACHNDLNPWNIMASMSEPVEPE